MFTSIKSVVKTAFNALFGNSKPTDTALPDGSTVTRITEEDGYWEATTRDPQGLEVRFEDANGYWGETTRNPRGLEVRFEDACGYWCTYQYDEQDRPTRFEDSYGVVKTHTYDAAGTRTTTVVSEGA